jgi:hypothetical protein
MRFKARRSLQLAADLVPASEIPGTTEKKEAEDDDQ